MATYHAKSGRRFVKGELDAMLETGRGVQNIVKAFESLTVVQRENTAEWYNCAKRDCEMIASEFNIPVELVAGVIAVVSPNMQWAQNVKAARKIIAQVKTGYFNHFGHGFMMRKGKMEPKAAYGLTSYPANYGKAVALLCTYDEIGLDWLRGEKVNSFWRNIMTGCDVTVTVDRHALSVIFDLSGKSGDLTIDDNAYASAVQIYINATDYVNAKYNLSLTPKQLQAVVWSTRAQSSSLYEEVM